MAGDIPAGKACIASYNNDPAIQAHVASARELRAAEAAHRADPTDAAAKDRYERALDHHADRSIGTVVSQFALEECLKNAGFNIGVNARGSQKAR